MSPARFRCAKLLVVEDGERMFTFGLPFWGIVESGEGTGVLGGSCRARVAGSRVSSDRDGSDVHKK